MKAPELLPSELVWTADGHLSEVAMTAIADGEESILPRDAFGHLGLCTACATGVENAASLSIAVSGALAVAAEVSTVEARRAVEVTRAFPVWAATLAVVVGGLATFPNFGAVRAWMGRMGWALFDGTPMLTRHAASFLPRAMAWLPVMSLTAAVLLLLAGLSVARLAPRAIER